MTRRDTIIIAVLVNAGLLVVLFTTSLKPSLDPLLVNNQNVTVPVSEKKESSIESLKKEHIDDMISKYKAKEVPEVQPSLEKENVIPDKKEAPISVTENAISLDESKQLVPIVVKQGDVLEKIAKANHTTVEEVMRINRLPNSFLKIGQVLYIPANTSSKNAMPPLLNDRKKSEDKYYVVKNGDNPWTIAVKNHIKIEELLRLNNLDEESARKLKPGDRLKIK